jgi:hypothetical protein
MDLFDNATFPTIAPDAAGEDQSLDFVQVFVRDSAELERLAPSAIAALKPDGLLWVCYPKGGSKAGTDLNRDVLWKLMEDRGFAGVTLVAIDSEWSAMRFRPPDRVGA